MAYNHGQEISVNEMRMASKALRDRFFWSLCMGIGMLALLVWIWGPEGLVLNIARYGWANVVFEFRKLPLLGVRVSDAEYVAQTYAAMVHQSSFWWIFGTISTVVSLIAFGVFTYLFFRRGEKEKLDRVMRGAQLVTPKIHNKIMNKEYGKTPPFEMGNPLSIGSEGALVPEALQYLHFAFAGASGSGKSTAIEEIITQALARGEKGFVIDLNGAFYAKYGRPDDHVLSVRDPRSEAWDFWHEPLADAENIAAAMIESEGSQTQYFWKGARALLASLLRQNTSVEKLWEDFQKSSVELREKLSKSGDLAPRIIGESNGDQSDGIIGTTVLDLAILRELNQWNESAERFSVTDWMNDNGDHSWTYVLVTDKDVEATKPLLRLWFDLACLAVLQRDSGDPRNLHTWLIIDELKTVGQLPSLPAILDKGRKYKSSVVLGFQAISQIRKIYGEDDARSILQGIQNQFFFRMSEVESAQYVSEALGEQDVEQASFGMSFGPSDTSDRGSVSRAKVRKKLVMPDEIRSLKTLQAIAKLSGHQPVKLTFEVKNKARVTRPAVSMKNLEKLGQPGVQKPGESQTAKPTLVPAPSAGGLPFLQNETRGEAS